MRGAKGVPTARSLRKQSTKAERRLWSAVRDRRLGNFKFRRQHPIGSYLLDFYCGEAHPAIELDGGGHAEPEQVRNDRRRDRRLSDFGIGMLRFWNHQVMNSKTAVLFDSRTS